MTSASNSMLAAVWHGPNQLKLENRPIPELTPGSMLIKVLACAVCGSDLRILSNGNPRIEPPRILGHEVSGEVIALGSGVEGFDIGDKVTTGADIPCGECYHCKSGRANCCDTNYAVGYQFDGGYAEYMLVHPLIVKYGPIQKLPKDMSWEHGALAEPLACCINGFERALYQPGSGGTVVVFGAGPIGLMLTMLAREYGAEHIVVIEPAFNRRAQALRFGADTVLDPSAVDVVAEVMNITKSQGAQALFTACPSTEAHEQAIAMVAKRGVVNLFGGLPKTAGAISVLSNHIHYKEAYITGSHGSTPDQHAQALKMIADKKIDADALISATFMLEEIHEAMNFAASKSNGKVVIRL